MRHMAFLLGDRAICPSCKGTLWHTVDSGDYTCVNCHRVYAVAGVGRADREIILEELEAEAWRK